MDSVQALDDLTAASSGIDTAVLLGADGAPIASTLRDDAATGRVAGAATALLAAAEEKAAASGRAALAELVVATGHGAVVCVRDAERTIVAVTRADPTVGLVLYDLRRALRAAGEAAKPKPKPKPKPRTRTKPKPKPKPKPAPRRKADGDA